MAMPSPYLHSAFRTTSLRSMTRCRAFRDAGREVRSSSGSWQCPAPQGRRRRSPTPGSAATARFGPARGRGMHMTAPEGDVGDRMKLVRVAMQQFLHEGRPLASVVLDGTRLVCLVLSTQDWRYRLVLVDEAGV